MKLLVFDTCFNKTYIVLREDETILTSKSIESNDENYHSAYLIPEIINTLKEHNILIKDLDAIGVNIGPGSFTGIRAGITIARVLAQQTNIKLIGVPSSQILAKINKQATNTLVLTDARKNKVYLSLYNCNGNALMEPMLEDKEKITDYIKEQTQIISDKSIGEFLIELGFDSIQYEENDKDFGLYLSEICYKELIKKNNDYNWAKVKPLYIQQPSITRPKAVTNV
ncbi:tRNA (adenosine(37)-N6)-threonylcarbamoyltransferase complex dimerization subunit type 1 TsaB [bacterium]|nr:tRNA (adenosine(37)-N6)-threonylcarbamoyltransferase complex dimerization subunit type 1 TsaB [bacterium]